MNALFLLFYRGGREKFFESETCRDLFRKNPRPFPYEQ
jgi:YHS domain-containing protein